jgi:hypothetical protein
MRDLLPDFRYGLRLLAKAPGFALAAVAVLALGLGASTTTFSLLNAILIRPLPGIAEPERLVMLGRTQTRRGLRHDFLSELPRLPRSEGGLHRRLRSALRTRASSRPK